MDNKYWIGPYGILVPNSLDSVPLPDSGNLMYKNSEKKYKEKYAQYNSDDSKWYFVHDDNFWVGPFGVLVPNNVDRVISSKADGSFYTRGSESEENLSRRMSEERYKEMYTTFNTNDGKWHYSHNNNYWVGPYGILVPNHIRDIVAKDGGNTLYKRGIVTQKCVRSKMTEETYKKTYAKFNTKDGKWYYVG